MVMSTQGDRIRETADKLIKHAEEIEGSHLRSFGYRERIAIERLLFLLLWFSLRETYRLFLGW